MLRGIYKNEDGSIGILIPTQEALGMFDSERDGMIAICEKDVQHNLPYWIVEDSEIPTDSTFRSAWEIDESFGEPDGFGGESNEFDAELLAKYNAEKSMTAKEIEYWNKQTNKLIAQNVQGVIK
jgi:hypothetical protein